MELSLIDRFIKELEAHVSLLETEYNSRKKLFDIDQFLRKNFSTNGDVYNSLVELAKARCEERDEELNQVKIFDSVAVECYELLKFFEPNTSITLGELKEAFCTCYLAQDKEVLKKYDRYKKAIDLLNTLKQLFVRHQFRKSENNSVAIEHSLQQLHKYQNLYNFLINGEEVELENLDSYYINGTDFTEEEWLEIYNHILLIQIKSYKKIEDQKKEENKAVIKSEIDAKARELEDKILDNLPKESVEIIKPVENKISDVGVEVSEDKKEKKVEEKVENVSIINDKNLLDKYDYLQSKLDEYRRYGSISLTKEQSFSVLYDSLNNGNVLENIRIVYKPSDYLKFLYYCFKKELEKIRVDIETKYPEDELELFTQLLLDDIQKPVVYLTELENVLTKQKEEQENLNSNDVVQNVEEEKPFKLIFYGKNGTAEILRDIKKFSPEKMQDLIEILDKIESGKLDKHIVINKNVPVAFKAIRGGIVFVSFRMLPDGHILIVSATNLDELNSSLFRLNNYDSAIESALGNIIKDGSFEYKKLMEENDKVKQTIYGQGFTKGV